jgi:hypothetical protein
MIGLQNQLDIVTVGGDATARIMKMIIARQHVRQRAG